MNKTTATVNIIFLTLSTFFSASVFAATHEKAEECLKEEKVTEECQQEEIIDTLRQRKHGETHDNKSHGKTDHNDK